MTFEGTLPSWISPYLDKKKLATIEDAVIRAESNTSGEIVPLIVKSSSTTGHIPIIVFSAVFIVMLIFGLETIQRAYIFDTAFWSIANVILAALTSYVLSKSEFVQRLLISEEDRRSQVKQRAELEFYRLGMSDTAESTGILVFVSLLEHRIEVMADRSIAAKLPPETWDGVVSQVLAGIRTGDLSRGLCDAIDTCGKILAENFPVAPGDENELRDHVVFKL